MHYSTSILRGMKDSRNNCEVDDNDENYEELSDSKED
jgi:hypothetical protein